MIQWEISDGEVDYNTALEKMDNYVQKIISGEADEKIWLLEHPSLYTAGTSANKKDLVEPNRFPVFETKRGGQYTYHGPGQRIIYIMLNLRERNYDIRKFVNTLESWIVHSLDDIGVKSQLINGKVGVWINNNDQPEEKIASIGLRVRKGITFHGISINVNPNLDHFDGIISCGNKGNGVTSLKKLGIILPNKKIDEVLLKNFEKNFRVNTKFTQIQS